MTSSPADAAAKRLSSALRCATISEKDEPKANLAAFEDLRDLIRQEFPKVSEHALTSAPEGGLWWRLEGEDPSLAPGVLLAHHDVVPASEDTLQRWSHPPFSGAIADGFIWGRGALDNKSNLFAMLEALEAALQREGALRRTLILYSGMDEEVLGLRGARLAAQWLKSQGVRAEFVLDEGLVVSSGIAPGINKPVAAIGLAEKGYATFLLSLKVGEEGHSSMPTRRSVATRLAAVLQKLERKAFRPRLGELPRRMLQALAPHMSGALRFVSQHLSLFGPLAVLAMSKSDEMRAQLQTTVALTRFRSGRRENAIPALAEAALNCRMPPGESVAETKVRIQQLAGPDIHISDPEIQIEPSRIASDQSEAYAAICKSIASVHPDAAIAPGLFPGHTDAIWFEDVAENIYRFSPLHLRPGDPTRIHGVDERIALEDYADMIAFYQAFLRFGFGAEPAD